MTRITRISQLRDCGIFRDFVWPKDLPDLGQYNLIYGWNGTGKTTLSRILRCLEKRTVPAGQVTVTLDGRHVQGGEFPTETVPVRVFNREFVAENVFPVGGGDLAPIFVLGAESVERQKELNRLKGELATAQSKLASARSKKQEAEKNFDQFCIDKARVIKDTLRSGGQSPYNNYDKADFRRDAEEMAATGDATKHRLSDAERDKLLVQHRATPKPKVREVTYTFPDLEAILAQLQELLKTTVVSAAIETLKTDPKLANWTREGLGLHRDRKAEQCLFCEQPLPKDRLAALEAHFSAQYEQFIQRLDQFIGELRVHSKKTSELRVPSKAELYDDLAAEFEAAETGLKGALEATIEFLDAAIQALEEKKQRAFDQVSEALQLPQVDAEAVEKLNEVIRKHNQRCDEFETRVNEARMRLAQDMIAQDLKEFIGRRQAVQQRTDEEKTATGEVQRLNGNIARLEMKIVEHRRPAEELNEELRKYLGHSELQLQVKETGYAITRNGEPAYSLSEGEMTAIALLYFLKSLQDKEFDLQKGIVVLDDPISSLDANALYLAYGFIRERTKNAGQLFILTHNFTLFREVRNWFRELNRRKKSDINQRPARFYMLDCARDEKGRHTFVRRLDPLLEQYESEYHYLFARVYSAAYQTGPVDLEGNYVLPNMARRLLEAFLAFRQPHLSGALWQKMEQVDFDNAKKLRILRFLNTYSHGDALSDPEHDPSVLAEGQSVLQDLLELIKSEDSKHFEAMKQVVNRTANSDE